MLSIDAPRKQLAVVFRPQWKIVGNCVLTVEDPENRFAQLGVAIHRHYWDLRIGALATHAAMGFGFSRFGMRRIHAYVDTRNERCWRMLERVGMRREGHLVRWKKFKDQWVDDYLYAMLDEEWNPETADSICEEMPPIE